MGALIGAAQDAVRASRYAAAGRVGAQAAVDRLVEALAEYDRTILSELVWAPDPGSQRAVAERLGVHPVSLQRNLPRAQARFVELLADPAHREVGEHATVIRLRLGPYLPASAVEAELCGFGVEPSSQTAQVLLHVAGPYMRCGQWGGTPQGVGDGRK